MIRPIGKLVKEKKVVGNTMTSNAFCSVYLLLLFCCKIQNVITYKFHYFLKELNYLISV